MSPMIYQELIADDQSFLFILILNEFCIFHEMANAKKTTINILLMVQVDL